jgi:hypothetical protein
VPVYVIRAATWSPLAIHVVDPDPHIREGLLDHPEELLGLLGVPAAEGVIDRTQN